MGCTDGEFVVAGGHKGRHLNAEVQRVRIWSRALTLAELTTVSQCRTATAEMLFGGAFPHELHAEYILDGSYNNMVATDVKSLVGSGEFVRGGMCGYERCPEMSPENCPLVKDRLLNFNTTESCEAFARFNFCRRAG